MPKKEKPQPKLIHIHAKCDFFEVFELIEESKAVKRLETIRSWFMSNKTKFLNNNFFSHKQETSLVVKTGVHNPTMF